LLVCTSIVGAAACDRFLQFGTVSPQPPDAADDGAPPDLLPPADLCFLDNFNGSAIDISAWTPYMDPGSSVAESNRQLVVTLAQNQVSYAGVSLLPRALAGLATGVEIVTVPTSTTGATMELKWRTSGGDDYILYREGANLGVVRHISGVRTSLTTIFFSATMHRFWRIRHDAAANMLWFEAGPDGVTFPTTVASEQPQISLSNTVASLSCGTYTAQSSPGTCAYDNFEMTGCGM